MEISSIRMQDGHPKEILLSFCIFFLPFFQFLYLIGEEIYLQDFEFFGLTFQAGQNNLRAILWIFLTNAVVLIYCILFHVFAKPHNKLGTRLLVSFYLFEFIEYLLIHFEEFNSNSKIIAITTAIIAIWGKSILKLYTDFRQVIKGISIIQKEVTSFVLSLGILLPVFVYRIVPFDLPELDLLFFIIRANGFIDVHAFIWVFGFKLSFLLLLCFWFLAETKWWKYALLSPILLTVYQMRSILSTEETHFDESEFISALPLLAMIVLVLVSLSRNAKNQFIYASIYAKTKTQIEKRILSKRSLKTRHINETRALLHRLKEDASNGSKIELQKLKDELEDQLNKA